MNKIINGAFDVDFNKSIIKIKKEIKDTKIKILSDNNEKLLHLYFNIGKIINDNAKYGNKFIYCLEKELKLDYPNAKGFSSRNLRRMQQFYNEYKGFEIWPLSMAKLTWTHNTILIQKIKNKDIRTWYANETIKNNWSIVMLEHQIDSNLYERQKGNCKSNNFKETLIDAQGDLADDLQKDPYIFNLPLLSSNYLEKDLEKLLIDRIRDILLEFGNGFSFIGNQYKLTIGNDEYYIDLLFYHIKLKCYIAVELKTTSFKPEYIGQLNFYLNALDEKIKSPGDNQSIGILLCKNKNKYTVDYSLKNINTPIGVSSYEIAKLLPTEKEINLYLDNRL